MNKLSMKNTQLSKVGYVLLYSDSLRNTMVKEAANGYAVRFLCV